MPKKKEKKIVDTGFVPGIYNYCDRWCERCPLQLRCMSYMMGKKLKERTKVNLGEEMPDEGQVVRQNGLKIAFVPQNPTFPEGMDIRSYALQDADAEVELAADGKIAVDKLQDVPAGYYDAILMDIQMPNMNGYEATKAIRKLTDERAKIPIIAMTANAFEEDRQAALAAGMDDYVAKPVEISELFRTIMKNL